MAKTELGNQIRAIDRCRFALNKIKDGLKTLNENGLPTEWQLDITKSNGKMTVINDVHPEEWYNLDEYLKTEIKHRRQQRVSVSDVEVSVSDVGVFTFMEKEREIPYTLYLHYHSTSVCQINFWINRYSSGAQDAITMGQPASAFYQALERYHRQLTGNNQYIKRVALECWNIDTTTKDFQQFQSILLEWTEKHNYSIDLRKKEIGR